MYQTLPFHTEDVNNIKIQSTSEIGTTSKERTKVAFAKCPLFGGLTVHAVFYTHYVPRASTRISPLIFVSQMPYTYLNMPTSNTLYNP